MSEAQGRGLRRLLKKQRRRARNALGVLILPRLYMMWMWFIYATSRVEHVGCLPSSIREHYGKGVFALWHDEIAFVAYAFRRWRPDTLASRGPAGEVIAKMLELCDFRVFRGGSSRSRRRRATDVVADMVAHMQDTPGVIYGITTDGSKGPAYRMKKGVVSIAVSCAAPLAVEKTWCKRYIRMKNWDGTIFPLPFNHIVHVYAGPFIPPRDAWRPEAFEAFRERIEAELCRVTAFARAYVEGSISDEWLAGFPEHCRDRIRDDIADLTLTHAFDEVIIDPPQEGERGILGFPDDGNGEESEVEAPSA